MGGPETAPCNSKWVVSRTFDKSPLRVLGYIPDHPAPGLREEPQTSVRSTPGPHVRSSHVHQVSAVHPSRSTQQGGPRLVQVATWSRRPLSGDSTCFLLTVPVTVVQRETDSVCMDGCVHICVSLCVYVCVSVCICVFSSVQFSHSVVSDSLRPHRPQHARPPCPSPTPRVHTNSCPLSR